MKDFKIGLALGGGAALGFAHIGVLKVFEEYGLTPDYIAGTSMGSIVGALYSCGLYVDDLIQIAKQFDFKKVCGFNPFNALKNGAFSTVKLENFIESFVGKTTFNDTQIPFKCTSVDLLTGEPYILETGCLVEAIRASSAIPGIFKPIEKDGKVLVDGGILNNVPYDVVKEMGANFVIAVDVAGVYPKNPKLDSVGRIIFSSIHLYQSKFEEYREKANKKLVDQMIKVDVPIAGEDFSKENIEKAIKFGEIAARRQIKTLLRKINKKKQQLSEKNNRQEND